MPNTRYSKTLVFSQFFIIALLISFHSVLSSIEYIKFFQYFCVLMALYAYILMSPRKFSIFPELKNNADLIKTGPYKWIRHPMYSALIFIFLPSVITNYSIERAFAWLALVIIIVLKMNYEEKILKKKLKGYVEYLKKTKRIIPFIY